MFLRFLSSSVWGQAIIEAAVKVCEHLELPQMQGMAIEEVMDSKMCC